MRVIMALWGRQLKRYFRSKSRMIGSLGQPILFLVALGLGFGPIYQKAGEGNYIQFLTPGIIAMSILFTSIFSGIEIIWDRQFGFLKETLVAPVSRLEIMLGRTLGGASVAMFQAVIVLFISMIAGFRIVNISMLPIALFYMLIVAVIFTALGTAIASVMEDIHGFQLIMNFLVMPIFFLSGSIFPIDTLPGPIGLVAKLNPLSYGVDAIRGSLIGITHFGLLTNSIILVGLAAVCLTAGSYLFSRMQI
jgi:ABC-2 type transport system permease protein